MPNFRFLRFMKLNSPAHDGHSGIRENMTFDVGQEPTGDGFDCTTHTSEQNDPDSIPDCTVMQQKDNQELKKIPKQPLPTLHCFHQEMPHYSFC